MPSTKEDATATATEQLGSMTLGESTERKHNETEPDAKNGTTNPTKLCSACGKKSDTLMKCRACKCVWYCDEDCQHRHWKEHKKECRTIKKILDERGGKLNLGTELDVGPHGKLPPGEECPICMRVMPMHTILNTYSDCCGKVVCCGCDFQHKLKNQESRSCAFCRTPSPLSNEEILVRLRKRVNLKDPKAVCMIALHYGYGHLGLRVDQAKCIDLLRKSADLGYATAHYQLGNFHKCGKMGLEQNEEEALKHWKKAAEGGENFAVHHLGFFDYENSDFVAAIRHWRLSSSAGYRFSMNGIMKCFENGVLLHADLAASLQAFYRARAEMKSDERDEYIKHLKRNGEYREEYNS